MSRSHIQPSECLRALLQELFDPHALHADAAQQTGVVSVPATACFAMYDYRPRGPTKAAAGGSKGTGIVAGNASQHSMGHVHVQLERKWSQEYERDKALFVQWKTQGERPLNEYLLTIFTTNIDDRKPISRVASAVCDSPRPSPTHVCAL